MVEAGIVAWLRDDRRTVAQLSRRLRRIGLRAKAAAGVTDQDGADTAHAQRDVRVRSRGDGSAELWALLPEPDALAVAAALKAAGHASCAPGEVRTVGQRRADLLVAAVVGAPALYGWSEDCRDERRSGGVAARIDVTIPVRSLAGQGHCPGESPGYGLVPSVTARDLAGSPDASCRGLLFDADTGRLVAIAPDLGAVHWVEHSRPAAGYQHPPVMEALVHARDRRCRAPGGLRAAARCDCDHVLAWPSGQTSLANTCALCRYHHRLKTHATGWLVEGSEDDGLTRTTPTRRPVTTRPHDYRDDDPPPF